MKFGVLSDYFDGAGAKLLTEVEVNHLRSNQHEFQGIRDFREFLGEPEEKETFPTRFHWIDDEENSTPLSVTSFCTWSNVRRNRPHRSPEYHLYYTAESEAVVHIAKAGDLLVLAKTKKQMLHVILCPSDTMIARQLLWLFGLENPGGVITKIIRPEDDIRLGFAARAILDVLGIDLRELEPPDAVEEMIARYGLTFPTTAEFSQFARDTLSGVDPVGAPDDALVTWMDHEEALFRHQERRIITKEIAEGFWDERGAVDVDKFLTFSLRVQNRRKSRAGLAFGHHVKAILDAHKIRYTREARTEKPRGPDFLFPGQEQYHDQSFGVSILTMLGAKTTCMDRWRQVLSEADKIIQKHLLTLQTGISIQQTEEMKEQGLQLVVPRGMFSSYQPPQQDWLMDVNDFLELVKVRQGL